MNICEKYDWLPVASIAGKVNETLEGAPRLVITAPPGADVRADGRIPRAVRDTRVGRDAYRGNHGGYPGANACGGSDARRRRRGDIR